MGKKKNSSVKNIDDQIKKLSSNKQNDKTPVIKNKDLVRKVKAKQIDEKIASNKKTKKKKGYYYKKKDDTEKTKVIKKVTTTKKLNLDECTIDLKEIYTKEINVKKEPNKDFYSNEFLNNVENKIVNAYDKMGEPGMKFLKKIVNVNDKTFDTNGLEMEKWDKLSLITLGMTILFGILVIIMIIFVIWICNY